MTEPNPQAEHAAEWVYQGIWRVLTDRLLVPQTPPSIPAEDGDVVDAFKPARGYIRYRKFWFWFWLVIINCFIFTLWLVFMIGIWWLGLLLAVPALLLAVVPGVLAYLAIHLRYDTTWYVMTERSLRLRRGFLVIHEMTFTFENVQNVKVIQGPMQRAFGISDLMVETAGSGGDPTGKTGAVMNTGRVEGIADAAALRDRILAKLRASRQTGVGDEAGEEVDSDSRVKTPAWSVEHVRVLRAIREELALARQGL